MKKYFTTLLLLFTCLFSSAQKHDNVWLLGSGAGNEFFENIALDFDFTPVEISEVPEVNLRFFLTSTTYSDWSGKLVMYSDGEKIYDRDNRVIEGGGALKGSRNIPHGAYFIPAPDDPDLVYLFHAFSESVTTIKEFYYTTIDLSLIHI